MTTLYTPNPQVTALNPVAPPSPFTADALIAAGFVPGTSAVNGNNPALVTPNGGTALQSELAAYTGSNKVLIQAATPGSLLWTVEWFLSTEPVVTPATPNGNYWTWPTGSLFIRAQQNGLSAVPVTAPPPVPMMFVLGVSRPPQLFKDGAAHNSWTAFNGTTIPGGLLFQYTGSNGQAENPGTLMPALGDYVCMVNIYGGQAIVDMGSSPTGPLDVNQV